MNIKATRLCMVLLTAMMIAACGTHVAEKPPAHLEGTLGALAGTPTLIRPENLAHALNIAISKPRLGTSYGYQSERLGLRYRVGANPWGITQMGFSATTDQSGTHAVYEELTLTLDKTYCLKPAGFSSDVGLKLKKMAMPISDSAGTYDVNFYESPALHGTVLRVDAASDEDCAKRVSLFISHFSRQDGPIVMTMIPREIDNRLPAHPPFTAEAFWQKVLAMIRQHNGYIGPQELQQALNVTFTPITIGYKSTARRELDARDGWYFTIFYDVTGPGYRSVQPGVVPDGQGSALTIEIPSFSFVDTSGQEECVSASKAEAQLLDAGWTPASAKRQLFDQTYSQTFRLEGKDSNLGMFMRKQGDRQCLMSIRVAGAW